MPQQQRQFRWDVARRRVWRTGAPQARGPGGREDPEILGQAQGPGAADTQGQKDIQAGGDPSRNRLYLRPGGHAREPPVRERRRRPLGRCGRHALVLGGRRPATVGHHIDAQRAGYRRGRGRRRHRATTPAATIVHRTGKRYTYKKKKKNKILNYVLPEIRASYSHNSRGLLDVSV